MTDMNYPSMPATLGGFVVLFVLVGCAAGFDRGGVSEAALAGNTEAMWKDGQQAVARGEALIAKGEKRLAQGYKKIRDGEAAISQGNRKVAQARQEYQAAAAAAGASSAPDQVPHATRTHPLLRPAERGPIHRFQPPNGRVRLHFRGWRTGYRGRESVRGV